MEQIINENKAWLDEVWQKLDKKLKIVRERSKDKLPYTVIDGVHDDWQDIRPTRWTNGFWGGLMWLMYIGTKDEGYRAVAERSEQLLDKAFANTEMLNHDVGFLWHITAGVNYRLTKNEQAKKRVLLAAMSLSARYNLNGKFIRAWNTEKTQGYAIIDCMMNLPLLYLASEITDDSRIKHIAQSHADTTLKNHIRPDGSVYHILNYDTTAEGIVEPAPRSQGYDPKNSSWSRGQAWAIYGYALSYVHTGNKEYLDAAKRVAHYFMANISENPVPLCDFRAPKEPVYRDVTAGACAACGFIEIAKHVPEFEKPLYFNAAMRILKAIEKDYCCWDENNDALTLNGCEAYHDGSQNMPIIYGDFYFAEAIYKLRGEELLFW